MAFKMGVEFAALLYMGRIIKISHKITFSYYSRPPGSIHFCQAYYTGLLYRLVIHACYIGLLYRLVIQACYAYRLCCGQALCIPRPKVPAGCEARGTART